MNGVTRLLSRRDKNHEKRTHKYSRSKPQANAASSSLYTIFTNEDSISAADKDAERKATMLSTRLQGSGITRLGEEQAKHALSWYPADSDKAYDLLVLVNESIEGELKDPDPGVVLLGAVNRNMVTCYLDALLFAMFARLDSFEAMLYDNFEDEPRKQLAAILRIWVNLLRGGQLIKPDLTKRLQDSLAKCGWEGAAQSRQQDASEAFTFITGILELPLLTLKMDIYHTGREDQEDDHRFVNERLLEVAIPEQDDDDNITTLEDCLETYFNNRIEVKRFLQRQNTMASLRSQDEEVSDNDHEKRDWIHVETLEIPETESPIPGTPISTDPIMPLSPSRPVEGSRRTDSIFTQRYTCKAAEKSEFDEKKHLIDMLDNSSEGRPRPASLLRKEVLMPAWQFFSLIPWYTDNTPKTDAQVAAHFSVRRPVLGICLKRYTMLVNGAPRRLNTHVDIPLEIGLPHFISDEGLKEESPLFGNFKLILQSVVCHRGVSVDSGHYVALVRDDSHHRSGALDVDKEEDSGKWLKFDDLANQRVIEVDIKKALRDEAPYLLFYQVQPIDEELALRDAPPPYAGEKSSLPSVDPLMETLTNGVSTLVAESEVDNRDNTRSTEVSGTSTRVGDTGGRRSTSSNHRNSITFEECEGSMHSISRGRTQPPTPEEQKDSFLTTSRRGSRSWLAGNNNKSRSSSQSRENRLSLTLSRLGGRGSKDKLLTTEGIPAEEPVLTVKQVDSAESAQPGPSAMKEKSDRGLARGKGRKDRFRSKSREPAEFLDKAKHKEKKRPDRECVVM